MTELQELPHTRLERRKLERDFKKGKINQQYSYTTYEAISAEFQKKGSFDWLPSKEGQSIEQWWLVRVGQQKNASSYTKPIPMGCFGVHCNTDTELDNKLREFICDSKYHMDIDYEGGNEWIITNVSDIYKELNFNPISVDDVFNNEEFMKLWFERIENSKKKYFEDKTEISGIYNLKEWQEITVKEMLVSNKKYHILGLAPRFGKTLTILDYFKQKVLSGEYSKEELWLVPASKSLSSNTSFVNDYTDFGFIQYFNIVKDVSLFVDEDKVIERLKLNLPQKAKIVIITDEGDLASHTKISIEKISLIKTNFDVVEQIVMTGTGIGKATKIFKGVSIDDINQQYITYSEMVEMGDRVVKRNFLNIQYDITKDFGDDEVLNIRQSVDDPINHPQLAKYIGDWTVNNSMEKRFNLQPTEIVMVFIKPTKNEHLTQLVETYESSYSDKVKCLILTGREGSNNRTAEKKVKKTYNDMRKIGDMRKLIVFSAGIGSRSFSVSKIHREINFSDSELTSATIQEFARVYTYEEGKTVADVIRVGFTPMQLAEQLYLQENEIPSYDRSSNERIRMFLMNNSFSNVLISENGNIPKYQTLGNQDDDIGKFLDGVCKFSDSTKYYMTRWSGEGLVIDTDPAKKSSKQQTKIVSTSVKNNTKLKSTTKNGKIKLTAEDERKLQQYVNIIRCIPAIAGMYKLYTISDFLESGYWEESLNINKSVFEENYNSSEEFRGGVDALFRQNEKNSIEDNNKRLEEYMKFIS